MLTRQELIDQFCSWSEKSEVFPFGIFNYDEDQYQEEIDRVKTNVSDMSDFVLLKSFCEDKDDDYCPVSEFDVFDLEDFRKDGELMIEECLALYCDYSKLDVYEEIHQIVFGCYDYSNLPAWLKFFLKEELSPLMENV